MLIAAAQTCSIEFHAAVGAQSVALVGAVATVARNGQDTVIATTITSPATGRYLVTFTIPSTWSDYDRVTVRLEGSYNGAAIEHTKLVGVVLSGVETAIAHLAELWARSALDAANPLVLQKIGSDVLETTGDIVIRRVIAVDGNTLTNQRE